MTDNKLNLPGYDAETVVQVQDLIEKTAKISGSSDSGTAECFKAINQAFEKGFFAADAFNQISATVPALTGAIARGHGITTDEFKNLLKSHTLQFEEFLGVILVNADQINKLYDSSVRQGVI